MLIDLDELISECPDPRSRKYIRESIQCYKSGAYRASVVSCWIAVAFDLVDKIRELAATGDAMAAETIAEFDKARVSGDVRAALNFEKSLLPAARDKFQFISPIEYTDLSRLMEDRNRCAHPSFASDTEVFEASPELARLHIVNAAKYVLTQPAAQGKQALDRLVADLDSNFFPSKSADVLTFLKSSALFKPRESLLRNYLIILLKRLMKDEHSWEARKRATNALFALSEIHPESWKRLITDIFTNFFQGHNDEKKLSIASVFLGDERGKNLWIYIKDADRLRLNTFVENYPTDYFDSIEYILENENSPLYLSAAIRAKKATEAEIFNSFWMEAPEQIIDRLLSIYEISRDFSRANDFAKKIRPYLMESKNPNKHLKRLASIAQKNSQVKNSIQFSSLIKEFINKKISDKEEAKKIIDAAELTEISQEIF